MLNLRITGTCLKHLRRRIPIRAVHHSQDVEEDVERINQRSLLKGKKLTEYEIQKIINLDSLHFETKHRRRKAEKAPLVKNFFIGKVDKEFMAYPQVIECEDYVEFVKNLERVHRYFDVKAKQSTDTDTRDLSSDLIEELKAMKMFARAVPQKFGGLSYFNSEGCLASECESVDVKFAEIIHGHRLVCDVIATHGTHLQKERFLSDLARGNRIGSVCLQEPQSELYGRITAIASVEGKKTEWTLNGSQSFVVKSKHSDLLVINAITEEESEYYGQPNVQKFVTFVLDSTTPGVTVRENSQTFGCTEVPYVTLNFFNVQLSGDDVISVKQDNRTAADLLICYSRMQTAILNSIQTKKILNYLINLVVHYSYNGTELRELQLFRNKIGQIACDLYALESMIYHTAGIEDAYENPKIDVESAIVKAYSLEMLSRLLETIQQFPSLSFMIKGHPVEEHIRNVFQLTFSKESVDLLKLYIGVSGLQHCDDIIGEHVKSHANRLPYWINPYQSIEYVKRKLRLNEFLHPSFEDLSIDLERSVLRLHQATEMLLYRHGLNASNRIADMHRLSESAIRTFAMFSSVARASRSYCIGLRYSAYETVCASGVVDSNAGHVLERCREIKHGHPNDERYQQLAQTMGDSTFKWPPVALPKGRRQ